MDHSAESIVRGIRATNHNGDYVLSDSEATLLLNLFASVEVTKAVHDALQPIPNILDFHKMRAESPR